MSTILKALRRLEREKSAFEARPLQDEIAAAGPPVARRSFPLVILLVATAALALGLGASLVFLWPREGEAPVLASAASAPPSVARAPVAPPSASPAPIAPPVVAAQPELPATPPAPVLEQPEPVAPVAFAPPAAAFASPVAVVERPEPPPRAAEPAPGSGSEAAAAGSESATVARAPAASAQAPPAPGELPPHDYRNRSAQKTSASPTSSPVARPVEVARAESPAPPAQPIRREPAPEKIVRANVPDVFVSSTIWHPQKNRRLAKVALAGGAAKELHEGDAIGPLVVSVIEPSGVIFLHDGVELRRRVGAKN